MLVHPPTAIAYVGRADTGAEPLLVVGDDGNRYWVKGVGNEHGCASLVNEWVVSELARVLNAPFATGVLIRVPEELLTGLAYRNGRRMRPGIWFGSRVVRGEERQVLDFATRKANSDRIPLYLAMWHLCLGADCQIVYEHDVGHRMTSIDHGTWLDNEQADGIMEPSGLTRFVDVMWSEPDWSGSRRLSAEGLRSAADAIATLDLQVLTSITRSAPLEWGVTVPQLDDLAEFLFNRRTTVATQLQRRASTPQGGRR